VAVFAIDFEHPDKIKTRFTTAIMATEEKTR